jgi:hypothetical protein
MGMEYNISPSSSVVAEGAVAVADDAVIFGVLKNFGFDASFNTTFKLVSFYIKICGFK